MRSPLLLLAALASGCLAFVPSLSDQCGDGILDDGEECDDANTQTGDGCDAACVIELGPRCGDGLILDGEECDDANTQDGDGCSSACLEEDGFDCDGEPSLCELRCGNGFEEFGEDCDGQDLDGFDCFDFGFIGGALACNADCTFDTSQCLAAVCGDGFVDGPEACDDANDDANDGCADCQIGPGIGCVGEPSQCQPLILESEPNDDGTPEPGGADIFGNDFTSTEANEPGLGSIIQGALSPAGDEDVYAVSNVDDSPLVLEIENSTSPGFQFCQDGVDLGLVIRDAAGNELDSDDDSGRNKCDRINGFFLDAGQTVFIHVVDFDDDDDVETYFLRVTVIP